MNAGAEIVISPGFDTSLEDVFTGDDFLWIPGCMTPTEIIRAEKLGAKMIKLFPGNLLGPSFLSAVKELFPDLLFMPTGGVEVDRENIAGWFKAGVCAVGMGSKLITKQAMENRDYEKITELTRQAIDIIKGVRNGKQLA